MYNYLNQYFGQWGAICVYVSVEEGWGGGSCCSQSATRKFYWKTKKKFHTNSLKFTSLIHI